MADQIIHQCYGKSSMQEQIAVQDSELIHHPSLLSDDRLALRCKEIIIAKVYF